MSDDSRYYDREALVEKIRDYYRMPDHATGGPLHIVLDDYNVEDHFIQWCVYYLQRERWAGVRPGYLTTKCVTGHDCRDETVAIAEGLLAIPEDEREQFLQDNYGRYFR